MPMSKMLYLQEVLSLGQAGIVLATVSSWSIGVLDFSCKAALVQSLQPAADLSPPGLADAGSVCGVNAAVTAAGEREQTSPTTSQHSRGALDILRKAGFSCNRFQVIDKIKS